MLAVSITATDARIERVELRRIRQLFQSSK